ncbi:MAG: hypothetical protein AAGU21_07110 [Solidesulfovibrio sp.]|uniref:toxin-antitoxin system YwqK family antitoxin n=1 Tax=Solidesulfovibrio sp. TaxID=2910990 RepID=UPI003158F616
MHRLSAIVLTGALLLAALLAFAPAATAATDDDSLLLVLAGLHPPQSTSATIGASGGSLKLGPGSVTFPAAAFDAPTAVTLRQTTPEATYGLTPSGKAYTLDMDDACLRQPANLQLRLGGPDRQVAVALSETVSFAADSQSANLPEIQVGTVSGGLLTLTLPESAECPAASAAAAPAGLAPAAVATKRAITFWAISGFRAEVSAHFYLVYPIGILGESEDYPQLVLDAAEEAYTKLCAMGFDFASRFSWPFRINILTGLGERDGETELPLSGKRYQSVNINAALCVPGKEKLLKATVGHEFFHAVQNLYDPRSALAIRNTLLFSPHFLWLAEASSTWFESPMLDDPAYVPSVFLTNTEMASRGLETGTDRTEMQNIGYWASGFLRFLRQDQGSDAFVFNLWTTVRNQVAGTSGYSDLRALIDTVGSGMALGGKWTTFATRFHTQSTGYSGWPMPPSDRTWYNASLASADIASDLAPYSARKLLFVFNTAVTSPDYAISVLTPPANLNYALYKGSDVAGPFTFLGNLRFGYPQSFTAALGDIYLVSVTNTDSTAPYTATEQAAVHIGPQESCAYCPDVPATAAYAMTVYAGSAYKYWRPSAGSSNYYASINYYDAAGTQPKDLVCNWPSTFNMRLHSTYYQSGGQEYLLSYDTTGSGHGTHYWYYENGALWYEMQYNHGQKAGVWLVNHSDGQPAYRGTYAGDKKNGTFIKYDTAGNPALTCVYADDLLQSGPTDACWQEFGSL